MKTICAVYRSRRNAQTYVFVDHHEGLGRLPGKLIGELGGLERAMTLALEPGRKLARVEASVVLRAIQADGYYLQMPPPFESPADTP